jgi:UDP-N-acetylglucosamine 2-epimerase (non-hydrolysing)
MKIMTVLGTRPELIRLSCVIPRLDRLSDHVLVHTGQNFDPKLSDLFFQELSIRQPDHYLCVKGATIGEQIGKILWECEKVIQRERPDKLLILGDTNSSLRQSLPSAWEFLCFIWKPAIAALTTGFLKR